MEIHVITSNNKKFEEYKKRLNDSNVKLIQICDEIDEGRNVDIMEIAKEKLYQAKLKYPDKKLIVDDRGFSITALKGFPGPFVKLVLNTIGSKGLIKLMQDVDNREAVFLAVLGYFDGKKDHFFVDKEIGFITEEEKGDNLRGWTELLYVYGYFLYPNRSLAELNDDEWENYLNEIEKNDFILKLKSFISQK